MGQIRVGHFEADGAAVNLVLGFRPDYFMAVNNTAADTEPIKIEWWREGGDAVELWHYNHDNDGGDDINTPAWKSSGGYISDYNTNSVTTGTTVSVGGGQGVTISATWMDDSDEIYYVAIQGDRDVDHGDINA